MPTYVRLIRLVEYKPTIDYIHKELEPFKDKGLYLPNTPPQPYRVDLKNSFLEKQNDVSIYKIETLTYQGISLLKKGDKENDIFETGIGYDNTRYSPNKLLEEITIKFAVPKYLIEIITIPQITDPKVVYELPEGIEIGPAL